MQDFITPFEDIKKELIEIDSFLTTELETSPEDLQLHGDEIVSKGNQIAIYLSRTGTLYSDAKYHLASKMKTDVLKILIEQMGATYMSAATQKEFLRSACLEESWLVDLAERTNRTCTHQLDWYRSVLSKYKQELYASRGIQ